MPRRTSLVSPLRYELAILTHGRSSTLSATLASFRELVRPLPTRVRVFADGAPDAIYPASAVYSAFPDDESLPVAATYSARQQGFCAATGRLWHESANTEGVDYVFWLEHDFLIERRVSLEQLADLLEQHTELAQVALVRNPCNAEEERAGGVVENRPGAFSFHRDRVQAEGVESNVAWLDHSAFFTTNPSLMRREFMQENPWPDDGKPYCEGRFGVQLVERGYRFGYFGDGFPWVRHIGVRDGRGY